MSAAPIVVRARRQPHPVSVRIEAGGAVRPVSADQLRQLLAEHLAGGLPALQIFTSSSRGKHDQL